MMRDMMAVTLRYDDGLIKTVGEISGMLPSKSITPFLGVWYEQTRPLGSPFCLRKSNNEEKVSRAFARSPSISPYSKELPLPTTREFPCESPGLIIIKQVLELE